MPELLERLRQALAERYRIEREAAESTDVRARSSRCSCRRSSGRIAAGHTLKVVTPAWCGCARIVPTPSTTTGKREGPAFRQTPRNP